MNNSGFIVKYLILMVVQVLVWNYCNFSQYVMLTFLPSMILCIPAGQEYLKPMIIAFITGFAVDFVSSGMLGLTSAALLPVAFLRIRLISIAFGSDVFERNEVISFQHQGAPKTFLCIILATALFLALYIWIDGAGTRPFWFNAAKFGISLGLSSVISFFAVQLLEPDKR